MRYVKPASLLFGMILGLGVAAVILSGSLLPVTQADCPQAECIAPDCAPCGNGDCNGDGKINIADAIHLLGFQFNDGPAPVSVRDCPPCPAGTLLATGQTQCFTDSGDLTACNDIFRPGQDGSYKFGCPLDNRLQAMQVGSGDEMTTVAVIDHCTNLMWLARTADINMNDEVDNQDTCTWSEALRWCDKLVLCNDGTTLSDKDDPEWEPVPSIVEQHGGAMFDDWRTPNIRELLSIVDYERYAPAVDVTHFTLIAQRYWSSTSNMNSRRNAHSVYLWDASTRVEGKTTKIAVLAVRTFTPPAE